MGCSGCGIPKSLLKNGETEEEWSNRARYQCMRNIEMTALRQEQEQKLRKEKMTFWQKIRYSVFKKPKEIDVITAILTFCIFGCAVLWVLKLLLILHLIE